MNNQLDYLYHLTSIYNCSEILRSGMLRPCIQDFAKCTAVEKCALSPGRFVHFNFCPRSLMLFKLTQGRCWSSHKIWGQEDAVHIEIDYTQMMIHLGMNGVTSFVVADSDSSHGSQHLNIKVFDVNSTPMACVESMLDVHAIKRGINFFDADKCPGKGAEVMVGAVVNLVPDMVRTIGVHDGNAKGRLLGMPWISEAYKKKISIRNDWYF